ILLGGSGRQQQAKKHHDSRHPFHDEPPEVDVSAARETQTISLSLRAKTQRCANAGCDQTTCRPRAACTGSRIRARLISRYPLGLSSARIRSPWSLKITNRSPWGTRNAAPQSDFLPPVAAYVSQSCLPFLASRQRSSPKKQTP